MNNENLRSFSSSAGAASSSLGMSFADWAYLAAFVAANLILRYALLGINQAEYTDGILQITVLENQAGLYPPLYGLLAMLVEPLAGTREMAGRTISAVAASLALVPVYLITVSLGRPCAARFSALFYTLCPLVLRWSVRVMTDALFLCLSSFALLSMWYAYEERRRFSRADWWLAAASLFAGFSALTRYQGALLAVLLLAEYLILILRWRVLPWRSIAFSVVWFLLPAWIVSHGFVHQTQFSERTAPQWIATLLAWLNLAESFVLIFPYYVGWPIFLFAMVGLWRVNWSEGDKRHLLVLWVSWGALLLILQSVFGSFQYRYLMPVFPFVIALAGAGASYLELKWIERGRPWLFTSLLTLALAYLVLFSSAVLIFQRQAFGDQRAAAEFIRTKVPRGTAVISNERYGNFSALGCVKLSYWSGRPVEPIHEYLPRRPEAPLPKTIPPGSYVVLGNAYGGDEYLDYLAATLTYYYHMRYAASYDSTVYPLMDDVMAMPMFNQNPLGWVMRYTPQLFSTHVYIVDGIRTPEEFEDLRRRQLRIPTDPTAAKNETNRQSSETSTTDSLR